MAFEGCKEISPDCPAEGTIYGYYPNHGVNVFFAVFFGVAFLLNVVAGLRWKTWTYMTALCFGAGAEVIGNDEPLMLLVFLTRHRICGQSSAEWESLE